MEAQGAEYKAETGEAQCVTQAQIRFSPVYNFNTELSLVAVRSGGGIIGWGFLTFLVAIQIFQGVNYFTFGLLAYSVGSHIIAS